MFWACLFLLAIGLGIGAWFSLRVLNASPAGVVFGLVWTTVVGTIIIVYMCYQFYTGKFPAPGDATKAHQIVLREIVVATPLILGGISALYFLATDRRSYITPVVIPSLALWLLLRLALKRRVKEPPS